MKRDNRRKVALLALSFAVLTALSVAVMAGAGSATPTNEVDVSGAPAIKIGEAGAGVSELAALKPTTQSEIAALPSGLQHVLALEAHTYSGGEIGAIGSVTTGLDETVHLAELGEMVCVIRGQEDPGYAYGCWSLSEATSGDAYMADPGIGEAGAAIDVLGIAPDGVSSVAVEGVGKVPVSANLWTAEVQPSEVVITGIDGSGRSAYQFELPLRELTVANLEAAAAH